jgi:hypothetical protein
MVKKSDFGKIGADSNMKCFKAVLLANPIKISYSKTLFVFYYLKYFSPSGPTKITSLSLWAFHYGVFPHLSVQSPTSFRYVPVH